MAGKVVGINETKKSIKIQVYVRRGKTIDVEVASTDDVKVRQANPPIAYDDKGRPMKRTHKELKELEGDSKLPGYPGEFSDLHRDQNRKGNDRQEERGGRSP